MSTEAPKQVTKKATALFSAQNRIGVAVLATVITIGGVVWYGVHSYTSKSSEVKVSTSKLNAKSVKAEADADVSEAYRDAKALQNEKKYKDAEKTANGVAVPFVFPAEEKATTENKIADCQCTVSDEQLIDALKRIGYNGKDGSAGFKRISNSDIYLDDKNNLVSSDGAAIMFRDGRVSMDQSGAVLTAAGIPAVTSKGETIYIGKTGEVLNSAAEKAHLAGDMLSASGEIYIGDGRLATSAGNRKKIGNSDIYSSADGQLMTVDARPITASGMFVYSDEEGLIKNRGRSVIEWEMQRVYVDKTGALVDPSAKKFKTPGILFSYKGVMIDNDGKLTKKLESVKRVGESDIYVSESGYLVDESSAPLLHYGSQVKLNKDGFMHLDNGQFVNSISGFGIKLEIDGAMTTSGNGIAQTGILKTEAGVAINKNGHLLSRPGYLERMGETDTYISPDLVLSDSLGRPLMNATSDVLIGQDPINAAGDSSLNKMGGPQVANKNLNKVFIAKSGALNDESGARIKETGILHDFDGVAFNADGYSIAGNKGLAQIFKGDYEVLYEAAKVFKKSTGQLVTAHGGPVLSDDGRAVYVDGTGYTVDEFGKQAISSKLTANGEPAGSGVFSAKGIDAIRQIGQSDVYITQDGLLVDSKGRMMFANGQRITAVQSTGAIINDQQLPVTDKNSKAISIIPEGAIVVGSGTEKTKDDAINTWDKVLISPTGKAVTDALSRIADSDIYITPSGSLVDSDGRLVLFGEKRVFKSEENKLLAYPLQPVSDTRGSQLFLSDAGHLSDKNMAAAKQTIITNYDGVFFDWDGRLVTDGGRINKIEGTDLYKTIDSRIVSIQGKAVRRKGVDVYIAKDGMLANKSDRSISIKGVSAFIAKDGRLVDKNGQAILDMKQLAIYLSPTGDLINEDGGLASIDETATPDKSDAPGFRSLVDPSTNDQKLPQVEPKPAPAQPVSQGGDLLTLDEKSAERLKNRYGLLKNRMRDQLKATESATVRDVEYELASVKGEENSGLNPDEQDINSPSCVGNACKKSTRPTGKILRKAGTMMFAVTEHKVNSDFSKQVMVKLIGIPQNDPLFGAKLFGSFQLKYDHLVLEFNKVALPSGGVASIKGVAIDAANADMGLQGEVDHHYLYRFGGLFVASLLEGSAEAATKTADKTETNDFSGSEETTTGLNGTELALASLGKTGQAFTKVFAENVTRPVTVTLGSGQEMGVILFEDIVEMSKEEEAEAKAAATTTAPAQQLPPELIGLLKQKNAANR